MATSNSGRVAVEKSPERNTRWLKVTYFLVYPGLAGSMLFDILDPFRFFELFDPQHWGLAIVRLSQILILLTLVVDFMHLFVHLDAEKRNVTPLGVKIKPRLDLAIAVLLCLSFFSLAFTSRLEIDFEKYLESPLAKSIEEWSSCAVTLSTLPAFLRLLSLILLTGSYWIVYLYEFRELTKSRPAELLNPVLLALAGTVIYVLAWCQWGAERRNVLNWFVLGATMAPFLSYARYEHFLATRAKPA